MVRYKMIGRDVDFSAPIQYRTWVVNDQPDFTGQFYIGLKSGSNSFVDITTYLIPDNVTFTPDFNLPNPLYWDTTRKVLPDSVANGQLAIIDGYDGYSDGYRRTDGYVYLFGGELSSRIYRADINRPAEWVDTGGNLPSILYGSQLAVIGNTIYLFGGNDSLATDHIYSASVGDPLNWTDHGSLLPKQVYNAQLVIINDSIYLLGGQKSLIEPLDTILVAPVNNPLVWTLASNTLSEPIFSSHVGIIGDNVYLFGGLSSTTKPTNHIYSAPLSNPLNWNIVGFLPYPIGRGQFFIIGNKGYLITSGAIPSTPRSHGTRILRCDLSSPTKWFDTNKTIPGEVTDSQLAIIYDRLFLFGGSGSSVIFSSIPELKYSLNSVETIKYADTTRIKFNHFKNISDQFKILGFAPWRTDYV